MSEVSITIIEDKKRKQVTPDLPQYEDKVVKRTLRIEIDGKTIYDNTVDSLLLNQEEGEVREYDYNGNLVE